MDKVIDRKKRHTSLVFLNNQIIHKLFMCAQIMWFLPDWSYVATKWRNCSWVDVIKSNCEQSEKQVFECFGKRECEKRHALEKNETSRKSKHKFHLLCSISGLTLCYKESISQKSRALFVIFLCARRKKILSLIWFQCVALYCIALHCIIQHTTNSIKV